MDTKTFLLLGTFFFLSFSSTLSTSNRDISTITSSRRVLRQPHGSLIQKFLVPHNRIRARLGLRPLEWSEKLANFAKAWANERKGDCRLVHSKGDYGENIFWGSGRGWTPSNAVDAWADEKKYYNYKLNRCLQNKDCLHYTQIVWKQSLRVGCAKVSCNNGDTFITCNYDPHGNVIGQKPF